MPYSLDHELIITLKDVSSEIYLSLHYLISNDEDVIVRYSSIINKTKIFIPMIQNFLFFLRLILVWVELVVMQKKLVSRQK